MAIWWQLGLALGLGLLVGLERERSGHSTGIRTFALITLLGASSGVLVDAIGGWIVPAALIVVAVFLVTARVVGQTLLRPQTARVLTETDEGSSQDDESSGDAELGDAERKALARAHDQGSTTLIAAIVMFVVGAMCVLGSASVAVALGGTTAVLLHWKEPMHAFVERIEPEVKTAIYRFVLIALVVLPVLPDETYGPYDVFNPFRVWVIVSLIVGISIIGYIIYKFLGARVGTLLGGLLGGIVSSTATTVSYARRARRRPETAAACAVTIMIASTVAFVRIVIEVIVVAPEFQMLVLPRFGAVIGVMAVATAAAYFAFPISDADSDDVSPPDDPGALKAAFYFGAAYAVILFAVAVAEAHFGGQGLYAVATLSGLTDVDAITLSTAEMMRTGRVPAGTGWRMMMVGGLANMAFKGAAVVVLGGRRLVVRSAALFGLTIVGGLAVIFFWPGA